MKKYKVILPVVALAAGIITIIIISFAWYLSTDRMTDMQFNILQIDSLVSLYEANDSNYNGVPDLSSSENVDKYYSPEAEAFVTYQNKYHTENYSFDYVDQRYALSQDSQANLLNTVTITDAAPSKVYGYKFEITNYVGLENQLNFGFIEENGYSPNISLLSEFEVRLGIVESTSAVTFGEWTDFVSNNSYSAFELNPLNTTMTIPANNVGSVGRLDLWLQIRIKSTATNDSISEFKLPKYRITLSCEMQDPDSQSGD
ncbi:MAG: hypothetical protein IJP63_03595 [Acholeplasmatales bacterium]|nr:hypothetical protein [Acholeplasmatales bacterium]